MHELSLLADLLKKIDLVVREQKARKVVSVKVRLGALSHISADHFREHFIQAVKGSIIEHASLEVEELIDIQDPHAQDIMLESVEVST